MARHAESRNPRRSALLKAGLTVTAAGAAVFGVGGAAQAADGVGLPMPTDSLTQVDGAAALEGLGHGVAPLTRLQLDPLANTGVDPLDNGLGTQVADFKPVGTNLLTDHVTKGGALADLPVAGPLTQGLLP
ncbi:hypothetical protein [Streptomyces showdoensis]|uniref:Uncharacterized protein n=1 Tax=Streptomyces showdoensis TaxID=68268 RepID=A0A2P2GMW5_STREW|nr:hypothetical protein [Streptomyces showdoensis]KKZ72846.1 hypothetical protein VO63_16025 [Streptomyces showdoensis]